MFNFIAILNFFPRLIINQSNVLMKKAVSFSKKLRTSKTTKITFFYGTIEKIKN